MTTVRSETIDEGITELTLDRPERLNAMSSELVRDLHDALAAVEDDRECRVVILTGAGRGFCAGLDLKETGDIAADVADGGGGPPAALRGQQRIASLVTLHVRCCRKSPSGLGLSRTNFAVRSLIPSTISPMVLAVAIPLFLVS